uniref:ARID domain-containing protein n=1 Tax=Rhabditophanes sp. KR3021 TaxID=114890 RepID=A0AC35TT53_9BILA
MDKNKLFQMSSNNMQLNEALAAAAAAAASSSSNFNGQQNSSLIGHHPIPTLSQQISSNFNVFNNAQQFMASQGNGLSSLQNNGLSALSGNGPSANALLAASHQNHNNQLSNGHGLGNMPFNSLFQKAVVNANINPSENDLAPNSMLAWPINNPVFNVPYFDINSYKNVNTDVPLSQKTNGMDLPINNMYSLRFFYNLGVHQAKSIVLKAEAERQATAAAANSNPVNLMLQHAAARQQNGMSDHPTAFYNNSTASSLSNIGQQQQHGGTSSGALNNLQNINIQQMLLNQQHQQATSQISGYQNLSQSQQQSVVQAYLAAQNRQQAVVAAATASSAQSQLFRSPVPPHTDHAPTPSNIENLILSNALLANNNSNQSNHSLHQATAMFQNAQANNNHSNQQQHSSPPANNNTISPNQILALQHQHNQLRQNMANGNGYSLERLKEFALRQGLNGYSNDLNRSNNPILQRQLNSLISGGLFNGQQQVPTTSQLNESPGKASSSGESIRSSPTDETKNNGVIKEEFVGSSSNNHLTPQLVDLERKSAESIDSKNPPVDPTPRRNTISGEHARTLAVPVQTLPFMSLKRPASNTGESSDVVPAKKPNNDFYINDVAEMTHSFLYKVHQMIREDQLAGGNSSTSDIENMVRDKLIRETMMRKGLEGMMNQQQTATPPVAVKITGIEEVKGEEDDDIMIIDEIAPIASSDHPKLFAANTVYPSTTSTKSVELKSETPSSASDHQRVSNGSSETNKCLSSSSPPTTNSIELSVQKSPINGISSTTVNNQLMPPRGPFTTADLFLPSEQHYNTSFLGRPKSRPSSPRRQLKHQTFFLKDVVERILPGEEEIKGGGEVGVVAKTSSDPHPAVDKIGESHNEENLYNPFMNFAALVRSVTGEDEKALPDITLAPALMINYLNCCFTQAKSQLREMGRPIKFIDLVNPTNYAATPIDPIFNVDRSKSIYHASKLTYGDDENEVIEPVDESELVRTAQLALLSKPSNKDKKKH